MWTPGFLFSNYAAVLLVKCGCVQWAILFEGSSSLWPLWGDKYRVLPIWHYNWPQQYDTLQTPVTIRYIVNLYKAFHHHVVPRESRFASWQHLHLPQSKSLMKPVTERLLTVQNVLNGEIKAAPHLTKDMCLCVCVSVKMWHFVLFS